MNSMEDLYSNCLLLPHPLDQLNPDEAVVHSSEIAPIFT